MKIKLPTFKAQAPEPALPRTRKRKLKATPLTWFLAGWGLSLTVGLVAIHAQPRPIYVCPDARPIRPARPAPRHFGPGGAAPNRVRNLPILEPVR